jgi:signal transduction histidine kinase
MDTSGARSDLLQQALDSTRDLMLIKGPGSRLVWANRAFRDFYGMTEQELEGIVDGPQSDPDDTLQYVRDDARVFEIADHLDIPSEAITDYEGRVRYFHTVKSPILDADGQVAFSVGVSRPLGVSDLIESTSHDANKAVTRALRNLSGVFPLNLVAVDTVGRVVAVSPTWIDVFGGPSTTESGFRELFPNWEPVHDLIDQAMAGGAKGSVRLAYPASAPQAFYDVFVSAWHHGDGRIGGALLLALDVTDDARRRAELEAINLRLDKANQDLDYFAHVAAHDLREPVRRQRMLVSLAIDEHGDSIPKSLLADLERVQEQSERMLELITGFRTLSGIAGPAGEPTTVRFDALVSAAVNEHLGDEHGAAVSVDVPATVVGHADLLRALLDNLMSNVSRYWSTPRNASIATEQRAGRTWFVIANSWDGDWETADGRLMQPFVSERHERGAGLGLSICKRVVEHHDGELRVEPEPGVFKVAFNLGEQ